MIYYQDIADLISCAFEGGSNYWLEDSRITPDKHEGFGGIWYGEGSFWARPLFSVHFAGGDDWDAITIGQTDLQDALKKWSESYPAQHRAFRTGDYDAGDSDTFLQTLVLGEVIFG